MSLWRHVVVSVEQWGNVSVQYQANLLYLVGSFSQSTFFSNLNPLGPFMGAPAIAKDCIVSAGIAPRS